MEAPFDPSLRKLIEKCCENDRKSQELLYKRFYAEMKKVCMRYHPKIEETNEVLNLGFLKVFSKLKDFRFDGSFEGWMRKIMVHTALDKIKADLSLKKQEVYLEENTPVIPVLVENDAVKGISAESVKQLLEKVPPMSRSVFNLYVFEGYSHKEISEHMGIKEGTSHWHLMNARTLLKDLILTYPHLTQ